MIASSFLTSHALVKTLHFTTQSAVESARSISPIRVPIDSIRKKKRKGKIHSPVTYPPRHLPPLPFSDSPQMNDRAAFPPPVARGVCMFHLEARSNYRLGEYRRRESEFPWTGRVIANIDFNLGRSKYTHVCCSPPRKKNKVDLFARGWKIYIYAFENGIYFRDRLRRVVVR